MSVSEEERHDLYLALEEVHGRDKATTLMSLLPPVGWADVATKRDLEHFETRMDARFDRVDARFDRVDAKFGGMDAKFDRVDAKFVGIDAKFVVVEGEFARVRGEMAAGFAEVRLDIANSRAGQRTQLLLLFVALVGLQLSGAGVALALRS
ncbi:MAG: hypothetical protein ACR2H3_05420, partial [Acidimicrobiales bacterium]